MTCRPASRVSTVYQLNCSELFKCLTISLALWTASGAFILRSGFKSFKVFKSLELSSTKLYVLKKKSYCFFIWNCSCLIKLWEQQTEVFPSKFVFLKNQIERISEKWDGSTHLVIIIYPGLDLADCLAVHSDSLRNFFSYQFKDMSPSACIKLTGYTCMIADSEHSPWNKRGSTAMKPHRFQSVWDRMEVIKDATWACGHTDTHFSAYRTS